MMYWKKILLLSFLLICSVFVLAGCWNTENAIISKLPYEIQTQSIYTTDNIAMITKTAKVQWSSDIIIASQIAWRVQSITSNIWDQVKPGNLLIQLQDTNNLSNSVQSAELAFQRAQITEQTVLDDIEKQKQKLQYDLDNINGNLTGSSTQIQLQKLETDLAKAEFDYQAKLKSDTQTNENLITSAKNIQSDLEIILTDAINETDKLLWLTNKYVDDLSYKDMRIFLWAKNLSILSEASNSFWEIYKLEQELWKLKSSGITADNVNDYLKNYQSIIVNMNDHFVIMKQLFIDSIEDARYKTQITTSQSVFASLQAKSSSLNASITNQLNSIRSYFVSYQDQQDSLAKQIESLRAQIQLTKKTLQDASFNTMLWAERSQISFDSQIKNNTIGVQSAYLQLQQARFTQSKFSVISPINAIVADILVDKWQDVSPGTPLLRIVSEQQQIEISLTVDEMRNISIGQSVMVDSLLWEAKWTIITMSSVADKSWSFKALILLDRSTIPTWLSVDVKIPVQKWSLTLPINALTIVDTNKAVAYFRDTNNNKVVPKTLTINSLFWDQIEIMDKLSTDYELIISDLDNYDERTMEITKIQ